MSTRIVDQVDSWDDRSFSGGYRQLQKLADEDFSGVVRAGGAELYMTRGVVVGINRGDIDDFQSDGTVYQAPTDALPLLAIMQDRSEEVRAKYYTEDTSISKVDKTLSDGGFTGYIELSENVLSGDYYLVYHAGTSMSVAYVGESSRLIEGDEAFETADDEVGIYEVRPVDIEPIEIPEPADDEDDSTDAAAATSGNEQPAETTADATGAETAPSETGAAENTTENTGTAAETAEATTDASASPANTAEPTANPTESAANAAETPDNPEAATERAPQSETTERGDAHSQDRSETQTEHRAESTQTAKRERSRGTAAEQTRQGRRQETNERTQSRSGGTAEPEPSAPRQQRTAEERRTRSSSQTDRARKSREQSSQRRTEQSRERSKAETNGHTQAAGDGETKTIPSLDPDQTAVPDEVGASADAIPSPTESSPPQDGRTAGQPAPSDRAPAEPTQSAPSNGVEEHPPSEPREPADPRGGSSEPRGEPPEPRGEPEATATPPAEPERPAEEPVEPEPAIDSEELEELETELAAKDETIDDLEAELADVTEQRDDLETELDTLRAERDELQGEVEELQEELRRLEEELGAATDADRRLTADEALAGTDIFVRYRSKGKATLEKAHGGSTRKGDVNENLRLEKHTQFDADTVAVGGQSYGEFLESTLEYQFVRWVVRELLFEIRDTGHEKALADLYNVLPRIDRAELSGVVEVTYTEDGQETQSQESFDVVLRNRMGNPLLAANLNDTREATTESMMERLITSAERVGQSTEGFSGAFLVTESFFDPGALEIASDATQGGLLSRDKRKSFVNLSRKRGYHLCLVEARNENFHLAVPEL